MGQAKSCQNCCTEKTTTEGTSELIQDRTFSVGAISVLDNLAAPAAATEVESRELGPQAAEAPVLVEEAPKLAPAPIEEATPQQAKPPQDLHVQQSHMPYMPPMPVPPAKKGIEVVSIVKGPKEAYEGMVDKGVELANKSAIKIFHQSVYAGFYIGFGGMLSMVVAGGLDDAAKDNPTIQTFVFAALFPVNLLIILLTGGCLITGTAATVAAAVFEKKLSPIQIPRTFGISWCGNLIGGVIFAAVVTYCDMNVGLTANLAMKVAEKKIKKDFFTTFIKGIGCNWLVCMAVFLSGQAQDMAGKMVGIWFPISCFVAIGFEHIPANMFMIPLGMMAGADVSVLDCLVKNFIPVTLGNIFAGSICVGAGYSFAFGALGQNTKSHLPVSRVSREDLDMATIDQMEKNQKEAEAKEMSAVPDAGQAA